MKDPQELIKNLPFFTFEPFKVDQTEFYQACLRMAELEEGTELQLKFSQARSSDYLDIYFDASKLGELWDYDLRTRVLPLLKDFPDLFICRVHKLEKNKHDFSCSIEAVFKLNEKYDKKRVMAFPKKVSYRKEFSS